RVQDREWRQGAEVEPDAECWRIPGMGMPGGPIRAKRTCQTGVMMMVVLRGLPHRPGVGRLGEPGNAERQEDLAQQRRDPEPGADAAAESTAHRRPALPPAAICAGSV